MGNNVSTPTYSPIGRTFDDLLEDREQIIREITPRQHLLGVGATSPYCSHHGLRDFGYRWRRWEEQLTLLHEYEEDLKLPYNQLMEIEKALARYDHPVLERHQILIAFRQLTVKVMGRQLPTEIGIMIDDLITHDRVPKREWSWLERTYLESKLKRDAEKASGAERGEAVSNETISNFWTILILAPFMGGFLAGFWGLIRGTMSIYWMSVLMAPFAVLFLVVLFM